MITKTSIRFFNKVPVRARWDDDNSCWWYAATDVVKAFIESKNPRIYWNTLKRRNSELSTYCKQLKLTAEDGKRYNTDCLNERGIKRLVQILPTKKQRMITDWIDGLSDPLDEQSKRKAYELCMNSMLNDVEVGTIKGLQQIHAYLFEGLYDFAGQIREKNISKEGFMFANCTYFGEIFENLEAMPDGTYDEIIEKYVTLNIIHPFMEGNGRATRIWLDLLLKDRLKKCVDWSRVDKKKYLDAMKRSILDSASIKKLINGALTDKVNSREIFLKGIDYSYYYEEQE